MKVQALNRDEKNVFTTATSLWDTRWHYRCILISCLSRNNVLRPHCEQLSLQLLSAKEKVKTKPLIVTLWHWTSWAPSARCGQLKGHADCGYSNQQFYTVSLTPADVFALKIYTVQIYVIFCSHNLLLYFLYFIPYAQLCTNFYFSKLWEGSTSWKNK